MKKHSLLILGVVITLWIIIMLLAAFASMPMRNKGDFPGMQSETFWSNEEKTLLFQVNHEYKVFGILDAKPDIMNVRILNDIHSSLLTVLYDNADSNGIDRSDEIEKFDLDLISDSEFKATVQETTYFHVGDEFIFRKISRKEYEAALKSMGALDEFIPMLGEMSGQAYRNEYFNLAAALDDGWHVYTEEELNESRGYSADELSKLLEARRSSAGVPVFCAKSADGMASVSVTIRKGSRENTAQTETEYAAIIQQSMPEAFEKAGMRCESAEVIALNFAGSSHPAVTVHAAYNGLDLYETLVPVKQGDYYAVIAATCLGQDGTERLFHAFQAA